MSSLKFFSDKDNDLAVHVHVAEAQQLASADVNGYSDPYVKLAIGSHKVRTKHVDKTLNPVFDEDFTFLIKRDQLADGLLQGHVYDRDIASKDDFLGEFVVQLASLTKNPISKWVHLRDENGLYVTGKVYITLTLDQDRSSKYKHYEKNEEFRRIRKSLLHHARQMHLKDHSGENIKVCVATWNVGNALPPPAVAFSQWLPRGYDIYSVGAQECKYTAPNIECDQHWEKTLVAHFGEEYVLVKAASLLQIRHHLFVHKHWAGQLSKVMASTEATGVGGVVGNKGGVGISFSLDSTQFCFVTSHLAAHQNKIAARNLNVKEIIKGLRLGEYSMDIQNQFDHVFWSGDLNYRIAYGDQLQNTPSKQVFDEMVELIGASKFDDLAEHDQLREEMKQGNVFVGFQEGPLKFPPTFKVARQRDILYKNQRSPAWCDRVLWRSKPELMIAQRSIKPIVDFATSDHKPVVAEFDVELTQYAVGVDSCVGPATLIITDLKAADLKAGDFTMADRVILARRAELASPNSTSSSSSSSLSSKHKQHLSKDKSDDSEDEDEDLSREVAAAMISPQSANSVSASIDSRGDTITSPLSATSISSNSSASFDKPGLYSADSAMDLRQIGTSDPFIKFSGPFLARGVKTTTKKKTLNPEWKNDEVPHLNLLLNNKARLGQLELYIKVFDEDLTTNQNIGYATLSLRPFVNSTTPQPFTIQVTYGGRPRGTISGNAVIAWKALPSNEVPLSLEDLSRLSNN